MKTKSLKITGLAGALVIFGSIAIASIHAQRSTPKPGAMIVTTNWIGYLVVGQTSRIDRITPEPFPTTIPQVEVGLRSDGVLVWQEARKSK